MPDFLKWLLTAGTRNSPMEGLLGPPRSGPISLDRLRSPEPVPMSSRTRSARPPLEDPVATVLGRSPYSESEYPIIPGKTPMPTPLRVSQPAPAAGGGLAAGAPATNPRDRVLAEAMRQAGWSDEQIRLALLRAHLDAQGPVKPPTSKRPVGSSTRTRGGNASSR